MEDANKTIHSQPATYTTTTPELSNSAHADDPPPANGGGEGRGGGSEAKDKNPEDQETVRESKRRKICPSALDKCEALILKPCSNPSSNCFSFTFDPKFSCGVSTPEVTPKFGSFNLGAEAEAAAVVSEEIQEIKSQEEKKDDDEVKENREFLEILGSSNDDIDGINADYYEEESNVFL